jgi:hypothetical protein
MRAQPSYRQHTVEPARRRNHAPIANGGNGDDRPSTNGAPRGRPSVYKRRTEGPTVRLQTVDGRRTGV